MTLGRVGNALGVEVCDDGRGFDPNLAAAVTSFGLLGMRERAHGLGGRIDIISAPGAGVVVGLTIPVGPVAAGDVQ